MCVGVICWGGCGLRGFVVYNVGVVNGAVGESFALRVCVVEFFCVSYGVMPCFAFFFTRYIRVFVYFSLLYLLYFILACYQVCAAGNI